MKRKNSRKTPKIETTKKHLYLLKNVVGWEEQAFKSLLELAYQKIVAGMLIRFGFPAFTSGFRGASYSLVVQAYENFNLNPSKKVLLRTQVRVLEKSLRLVAGTRGGLDRPAGMPRVRKEYKYTPEHNDLIIGVDGETLDLYFIPTQFLDKWGKSVSKGKLKPLKNNIEILKNWNEKFLGSLEKQL